MRSALLVLCAAAIAGCATDIEATPHVSNYTPSDFELQQHQDLLRSLADQWGIERPPDVEVVRWVAPEEYNAVTVSCLNDQGFPVVLTSDGYAVDIQNSVADEYNLAQYSCAAKYPVHTSASGEFGAKEATLLYSYYRDTQIPCLEQHGYHDFELPTLEVFLAGINSPQMYDPINDAAGMAGVSDTETVSALAALCPYPSAAYLWGDTATPQGTESRLR